jgi:hypothetical protein
MHVKNVLFLFFMSRMMGTLGFSANAVVANKSVTIQRLTSEMSDCLKDLNYSTDNDLIRNWADLIYGSMVGTSRSFHRVHHVFDISEGLDSIQKLAAYFHDIVYYSIDGGLNQQYHVALLNDTIIEEDGKVYLTSNPLDTDTEMVIDVFGFHHGQILNPYSGMNELLSAIIAIRCCQAVLQPKDLVALAAHIELTIPFRPVDESGRDAPTRLFDRLKGVNDKYKLEMSEDAMVTLVKSAVNLSNCDVGNFASPNHALFLSNTWELFPESNLPLRPIGGNYYVSDYLMALKKMSNFFHNLDPEVIFGSFKADNDELVDLRKKTELARENIRVGLAYMKCKQLGSGVVLAVAILTGGDAPLSEMIGELVDCSGEDGCKVSSELDKLVDGLNIYGDLSIDEKVFRLLRDGREKKTTFDIKTSPISARLYASIGNNDLENFLNFVQFPMDKSCAEQLLKSIPRGVRHDVMSTCSRISETRKDAILNLMNDLEDVRQVR